MQIKQATSKADLMKLLKINFPDIWTKDGKEFAPDQDGSIWSGEGSYYQKGGDRWEVFNNYSWEFDPCEDHYIGGVLKELHDYLNDRGWFAEFYDGGTVFFYQSK